LHFSQEYIVSLGRTFKNSCKFICSSLWESPWWEKFFC